MAAAEPLGAPAPRREEPEPPPRRRWPAPERLVERLREAGELLRLVAVKTARDGIPMKAAALAFITLLSLIPLLAAFAFVGTRVLDQYEDRILEVLTEVMPYSEDKILDNLQLFVHQAESLQEFGTLIFILVGLGAFVTIEETINAIWQVSTRRSLRAKLLSFTLLVFWGPLVIGSGLSLLVVLRQRPGLDVLFAQSLLLQAVPFLVSLLGLTMLYWQVPYTQVRFRAALAGGATAALLLELIRRTFGFYMENLTGFTYVVYGGFAFAVFFMVSVQVAWLAVLLGAEVAYVLQHFRALTRTERLDARFREPWIGLAVLLALADGLRRGEPIKPLDGLAERLNLSPDSLRGALGPLVDQSLITEVRGEPEGYVLARDPHQLTLEEAFAAYDLPVDELMRSLPADLRENLAPMVRRLRDNRGTSLAQRPIIELVL